MSNVIFSSMILEEKIYRTERKRRKAVVFLFLCFFFLRFSYDERFL